VSRASFIDCNPRGSLSALLSRRRALSANSALAAPRSILRGARPHHVAGAAQHHLRELRQRVRQRLADSRGVIMSGSPITSVAARLILRGAGKRPLNRRCRRKGLCEQHAGPALFEHAAGPAVHPHGHGRRRLPPIRPEIQVPRSIQYRCPSDQLAPSLDNRPYRMFRRVSDQADAETFCRVPCRGLRAQSAIPSNDRQFGLCKNRRPSPARAVQSAMSASSAVARRTSGHPANPRQHAKPVDG